MVLAGCATTPDSGAGSDGSPGSGAVGSPQEVQASDTTGGIRGVVVDQAVRPIKGATVTVSGNGVGKNLTTDAGGTFTIGGLPAGTYLLKSSHPLYDSAQQSVEVKAGIKNPPVVKIQLNQKVFSKPYMSTLAFKGFIICSLNAVTPEAVPVVGGAGVLSEECGEGVGNPKTTCDEGTPPPCVDNPGYGLGPRLGHQGDNHVQFDFTVDGPFVKTLVIEQYWQATSDAGKGFYTPTSTNWACDPVCDGNTFLLMEGPSPLLGRAEFTDGQIMTLDGKTAINITAQEKVSMFTWASPATTPVGVVLNQEYQSFVSAFYYLPAPADWSFVKGSPNPFQ
jgi:hypothetical protein